MKQVVLVMLLVLFITPVFSQRTATGSSLLGDINADSNVNIVDALMIAQYYVGQCDCLSDPAIADVNLDGSVNILDSLQIAKDYVGDNNSSKSNDNSPIYYGNWILKVFGSRNSPVPPLKQITLMLSSNVCSGNSGCNSYGGNYEVNGASISIGPLMSTAMACDGLIMQQENQYLDALQGAQSFVVTQSHLIFYCSGNRILVYNR